MTVKKVKSDGIAHHSKWTLFDFIVQEIATAEEFELYQSAHQLDRRSLNKAFPDDLGECAPHAVRKPYEELPYENPQAAREFMANRRLIEDWMTRLLDRLDSGKYVLDGLDVRNGKAVELDSRVLIGSTSSLNWVDGSYEEGSINLAHLEVRLKHSDLFQLLVNAIKNSEADLDPVTQKQDDFREHVGSLLNWQIPRLTFTEALRAAEADSRWFKGGRKQGSASFPNPN